MHPLVKSAPVVAVLALLGGVAAVRSPAQTSHEAAPSTAAWSLSASTSRCGRRAIALDDGGPCIPLPDDREADRGARARRLAREPVAVAYRSEAPREQVSRLPERPEEWARYQLPVDPSARPDRDTLARDGASSADGGPPTQGVRLQAPRGTPVQLVELEGQSGPTEVLAVGELRGITVVTRHRVEREGQLREYLVFHSRLDQPGPRVAVGARLSALAIVGFVGSPPSGLELDVRELRAPLAAPPSHLADLEKPGIGFAVDPRNVLPLKP